MTNTERAIREFNAVFGDLKRFRFVREPVRGEPPAPSNVLTPSRIYTAFFAFEVKVMKNHPVSEGVIDALQTVLRMGIEDAERRMPT